MAESPRKEFRKELLLPVSRKKSALASAVLVGIGADTLELKTSYLANIKERKEIMSSRGQGILEAGPHKSLTEPC